MVHLLLKSDPQLLLDATLSLISHMVIHSITTTANTQYYVLCSALNTLNINSFTLQINTKGRYYYHHHFREDLQNNSGIYCLLNMPQTLVFFSSVNRL